MFKYIILKVFFFYDNIKNKRLLWEEFNYVVVEWCRREKLNERFIMLRLLVLFVIKMDKVLIFGDIIEYVNYFFKRIYELEFIYYELN